MEILIDGNLRSAISRMFPIWRELGHRIAGSRPDVQLSSIKIRKFNKLPKVLRLDGIIYDSEIDWNQDNWNIKRSYSNADAVIFQSECCREFSFRYFGKRENTHIIYNGIDHEQWYNPVEHKGINIVSCANWRRWKRLPEIIRVFNHFRTNRTATLHIIGEMKRGAEEIPTENVIYHGSISEESIRELYKSADLYLHLGKNDSCPSSVVEAIGAGIPVITTNACGGAMEMAKMAGNHIVEGDYQSYKPQKIYGENWNSISDETIRGMSKLMNDVVRSIEFPEDLHIKTAAKKYLAVLESVI